METPNRIHIFGSTLRLNVMCARNPKEHGEFTGTLHTRHLTLTVNDKDHFCCIIQYGIQEFGNQWAVVTTDISEDYISLI